MRKLREDVFQIIITFFSGQKCIRVMDNIFQRTRMNGLFESRDLLRMQSQDVQISNRERVTVEPLSEQVHAPQRTWKSEIGA